MRGGTKKGAGAEKRAPPSSAIQPPILLPRTDGGLAALMGGEEELTACATPPSPGLVDKQAWQVARIRFGPKGARALSHRRLRSGSPSGDFPGGALPHAAHGARAMPGT